MKRCFSYDEVQGLRVFHSLENARKDAGRLKEEGEDVERVDLNGYRILICYGTIEELVLIDDTDLEIDWEGA